MLTNAMANKILNFIGGKTNIVYGSSYQISGKTVYVGLSYTEPNKDGEGYTEPLEETGYTRVLLGHSGQSLTQLMGNAANSSIENVKTIFFPKATASYSDNVTHFLIFHEDEGNEKCTAYGELNVPIKPLENTVPLIEPGNLKITIDNVI